MSEKDKKLKTTDKAEASARKSAKEAAHTARRSAAGDNKSDNGKKARNVRIKKETAQMTLRRKRAAESKELKGEIDKPDTDKKTKKTSGSTKKKKSSGTKQIDRASKTKTRRIDVCLTVAIAVMLVLGIWRVVAYAAFKEKKLAVTSESFRPNTMIDSIDISDMTYSQAVDLWKTQIEPAYSGITVTFDDGTAVTAEEFGCTSDYMATIEQAWHSGRKGTLEQRYELLMSGDGETVEHSVNRRSYDDLKVRAFVSEMAARTDSSPENAGLESFDTANYQFVFHESRPGTWLNQEKLVQDIETALDNGGGHVVPEINAIEPEATTQALASEYGMICEARTDASSSNKNRQANIQLALSMLNGVCIEPGETFSFNKTVGERTKARGFKEAPAYIRGTVQDQVGGGICQVSTTLFNAAVKADMTIKERHAHSMSVSYVDPGKDATVDWDSKDLKFTNNTSEKIYICGYLTSEKTVRIGMFGHLLPNGETITVETKKNKSTDYSTQYQVNFLMPTGETKKLQTGKKGCTAETIKVRKDAQGQEISRETLFKSSYSPTNEIIEYGP